MTADQVFQSPQFASLPEQRRVFFKAYVVDWDKIAAAKVAWQCKDDRSATSQADRALRHPQIAGLIAMIDPTKSRMTKDEALEIAAKHARTADKAADALRCLQLIGEWEGWSVTPPSKPDDPDDIYTQAEKLEPKS